MDVDELGVCGALQIADPADACSTLRGGVPSNGTDLIRFALILRGNCSFEDKIVNAQIAGFRAVIVYDDREKADLVYSESRCPSKFFMISMLVSLLTA